MDENIQIREIESYFDKYIIHCELHSVAMKKLSENEILILPAEYSDGKYYFAQETVDFVKFCRDKNNSAIDVLSDGAIKVRSLHSFDIWMPIIFIASYILLPTVVNLVSNFIYDKMKGREHEEANVNVNIVIKNGKKEKHIKYNGDAKSFKDVMDKIDLNK